MRREPVPRFPIRDVVEHYGGDAPPESRLWTPMRCWIHAERRPSAAVCYRSERFHCLVCLERSVDAIGLIMFIEGMDFRRALEEARRIADPVDGDVRRGGRGRGMLDLLD